ncbi:MAG TPA: hypothetical protein PKK23_18645 [Nitrospirales bacterium]|nr:hypothetical protein [Nitrospiraceae bacterium]HNP31071.1 hypothetical protein [Nitrospirales bacterium]
MKPEPVTMEGDENQPSAGSEQGLRNLLDRLEHQSLQPDFQRQRQLALGLALQPYLDPLLDPPLVPLQGEEDLARWFVYADYLPTDGHTSLIEQIRDLVTEHVPQEERVWLDSLRHSYMDLLEVQDMAHGNQATPTRLQSLGDQQKFEVLLPATSVPYKSGHVLLTRLLRGLPDTRLPGPPLLLSASMGKAVFTLTNEMRREIEIGTGNFALSEWAEFAKNFGYMMMWSVARVRRGAWTVVDSQIDFQNTQGETFLYAIALYEHHDFPGLIKGLRDFEEFIPEQVKEAKPASADSGTKTVSWVWLPPQESPGATKFPVARLTLTPTQLFIETDSAERLDTIKHQLAATFGFSLHFKGETTAPPSHKTPEVDLLSDNYLASPTIVPQEEEQQILASLLETAYLEWAETTSPLLNGQSPRHYCQAKQDTKKVADLIDQMEQHDLGRRRTGQPAYNYNILRGHIGL